MQYLPYGLLEHTWCTTQIFSESHRAQGNSSEEWRGGVCWCTYLVHDANLLGQVVCGSAAAERKVLVEEDLLVLTETRAVVVSHRFGVTCTMSLNPSF